MGTTLGTPLFDAVATGKKSDLSEGLFHLGIQLYHGISPFTASILQPLLVQYPFGCFILLVFSEPRGNIRPGDYLIPEQDNPGMMAIPSYLHLHETGESGSVPGMLLPFFPPAGYARGPAGWTGPLTSGATAAAEPFRLLPVTALTSGKNHPW